MFEELPIILLTGLMSGLSAGIAGFFLMRYTKNSIKNELFDYLESKDGIESIASIGRIFGAAAMSGFKLPKTGGSFNLFGMKIPNEVVSALIGKYLPQALPQIPAGEGESQYG